MGKHTPWDRTRAQSASAPRVAQAKAQVDEPIAPALRSGSDRRAAEHAPRGGHDHSRDALNGVDVQESPAGLAVAQASRLHAGLGLLNLATTSACLLFALWWWNRGVGADLAPWLTLGGVAAALRLALQVGYLPGDQQGLNLLRARRFLWLASTAGAASGLMLGWAWLAVTPGTPTDEKVAFMLAHVALLIWSLQASSAYLPAFMAFSLASLLPALVAMAGWVPVVVAGHPATVLGLLALLLLSSLFAVRFAREFRTALALQERVHKLLEEVTATRDEAVLATQAKSRFLASVSHDLRQPMHAMNLYLASLAGQFDKLRSAPGDLESAQGVQDGIRSLQDSTLYLNTMFESLLDISRLNAGSVAVEVRHTTLHRMLAQLEADYTRQAAAQGMRFELRLPAQVHLMEVETDPALLERLLRNLLVNAFRYTRAGGVRLSVVARGRSLDFRVVDTGPGIERAMRRRVFEEFFQVPGSQPAAAQGGPGPHPSGRGIGLGLSISSRLADKLGSRIRLHSYPGRGSVFAFRQAMRIALRPQRDTLPVTARGAGGSLPPGLFLAVIDDDADIRRSTRQMLEVLGVEVFTAESAVQAVQQLGRLGRVPDLLLSDYRLGAENGVQAIAMLREEFNHDIPALLITGDTSPERLEEFRATGLRVLYKPISGAQLLAAVEDELQTFSPAAP
jgi:signal transduction histidine kinase/CheY-like chemotaxis protein